MENRNGHFSLNNIKIIIFLIKTPKKSLINMLKERTKDNVNNREKTLNVQKMIERQINQINFFQKIKKEYLLYNEILDNKIIFVEPIKSWEKYGLKSNAHSISLFNILTSISLNDFSFNEKTNKYIFNMIKYKIKKIKEFGSSIFCALFFNKELNRMITVSVGNILYSILRENNSRKYEIIYISKEQYHDINIPFQISSLNQDYENLSIQFHYININDIIIISNNKKTIFDFNEYINNGKNNFNFFYDIEKSEENRNIYLAEYKISNERKSEGNNDNISIFSTSQDS